MTTSSITFRLFLPREVSDFFRSTMQDYYDTVIPVVPVRPGTTSRLLQYYLSIGLPNTLRTARNGTDYIVWGSGMTVDAYADLLRVRTQQTMDDTAKAGKRREMVQSIIERLFTSNLQRLKTAAPGLEEEPYLENAEEVIRQHFNVERATIYSDLVRETEDWVAVLQRMYTIIPPDFTPYEQAERIQQWLKVYLKSKDDRIHALKKRGYYIGGRHFTSLGKATRDRLDVELEGDHAHAAFVTRRTARRYGLAQAHT